MKKSLLSASVASMVLGLGAAACAQETDEASSYANESVSADVTADTSAQIEGQNVFDINGQPVGTVETVVAAEDGSQHAILSVGGFLGLGAKKISVSLDELQANADGTGYTISMTADEIEAAPAYEGEEAMDQPAEQ